MVLHDTFSPLITSVFRQSNMMSYSSFTRLKNKKLVSIIFITSLLYGCSGNYAFKSNLSVEATEHYFSASKVEVYNDETEFDAAYRYVGLIEGEDCQKKSHLAPPDPVNARTQARQTAFLQQANAIIFTRCIDIDTKHCVAQIVCYGKAYQLGNTDKKLNN